MKNYTITVNGNVYDVVVEEAVAPGLGCPLQRQLLRQHPQRLQQRQQPVQLAV